MVGREEGVIAAALRPAWSREIDRPLRSFFRTCASQSRSEAGTHTDKQQRSMALRHSRAAERRIAPSSDHALQGGRFLCQCRSTRSAAGRSLHGRSLARDCLGWNYYCSYCAGSTALCTSSTRQSQSYCVHTHIRRACPDRAPYNRARGRAGAQKQEVTGGFEGLRWKRCHSSLQPSGVFPGECGVAGGFVSKFRANTLRPQYRTFLWRGFAFAHTHTHTPSTFNFQEVHWGSCPL